MAGVTVRRTLACRARAIDVCTGDADGLCSILQWRLHEPKLTSMVSGPLCVTDAIRNFQVFPGDEVLVCNLPLKFDPSTQSHASGRRATVQYLDCRAHDASACRLRKSAVSAASPTACTSQVVDHLLQGAFRGWAMVGAYGSHRQHWADAQATASGLGVGARNQLQCLGEVISYNAEVTHARHLYLEPAHLYAQLAHYQDPLEFMQAESLADELDALRQADLRKAFALLPYWSDARASVYVLPDEDWASRVARQFQARLNGMNPERTFAVLSPSGAGTVRVAVQTGMKTFKVVRPKRWLIGHLPLAEVDNFVGAFSASGWGALRTPVFRAWR
jgi:hypothetical protein